jgi:hypothetical protein
MIRNIRSTGSRNRNGQECTRTMMGRGYFHGVRRVRKQEKKRPRMQRQQVTKKQEASDWMASQKRSTRHGKRVDRV